MGDDARHLAFIGMTGAGKTAIARRVAQMIGRAWVDTDHSISAGRDGQSIADVFAEIGEPAMRDLESTALLDALGRTEPIVISTGAGIVERPENREALAAGARVVWLHANQDVLAERLRNSSVKRPLLAGDLRGNLKKMGERRGALYRDVADLTVDVGRLDVSATAGVVMGRIRDRWPDLTPSEEQP